MAYASTSSGTDDVFGGLSRAPTDPARWTPILSRVLPVLLVAAFVAFGAWQYDRVVRDEREGVAHAQRVLLITQRIAILEETATSAERSFALTGDASFLASLFPSLEALPATAQRLEALVAPDAEQAGRAATVSDLVSVRVRQMWESIEARRRYGARAGRSAVGNPQTRETDRRLTEVLDAMARTERAVLSDRQARVNRFRGFLVLTGFAAGMAVLVAYGAQRFMRRRGKVGVEA